MNDERTIEQVFSDYLAALEKSYGPLAGCVFSAKEVSEMYRAELARLREAQRWIPVSEKLPGKSTVKWRSTDVLVVMNRTKSVKCCQYKEAEGDGEWYFYDGSFPYIANDITHWRPLPPPPEVTK